MRAEIVHVTDHALLRWRQRAAVHANEGVNEIVKAVKESRVVKKKELLPYPMPRLPYSVYTVKDEILFVLESVTITEYRLVTVITDEHGAKMTPKKRAKKPVPEQKEILEFPKPKKQPKKQKTVAVAATAPSKMYQRPPIILSLAEVEMVNEALMDVAQKLGLVVNL
jgi:hypothetical protein